MEEQYDQYISDIEAENRKLSSEAQQYKEHIANTSFQSQESNNTINLQLETIELKEMLEHFLRGDYISTDQEGNQVYTKQTDDTKVLFNEYGVNAIMTEISTYVDKNTILSYYPDEMRINEILADIGDLLAEFIFCNYEVMGLNTEFKKSKFKLVILSIVHLIENSYRRALRGMALDKLNSSTLYSQSDITRPIPNQPKQRTNSVRKFLGI